MTTWSMSIERRLGIDADPGSPEHHVRKHLPPLGIRCRAEEPDGRRQLHDVAEDRLTGAVGILGLLRRLVVVHGVHEDAGQHPFLEQRRGDLQMIGAQLLALVLEQTVGCAGVVREDVAVALRIERCECETSDTQQQAAREGLVGGGGARSQAQGVGADGARERAGPEDVVVEARACPGAMLAEHGEAERELTDRVHAEHADRIGDGDDRVGAAPPSPSWRTSRDDRSVPDPPGRPSPVRARPRHPCDRVP
jgi:hypothetical protein